VNSKAKDLSGNKKCKYTSKCDAWAKNHCCTEKSTKTLGMRQCSQFEKSEK
jgi:hypothetical protein